MIGRARLARTLLLLVTRRSIPIGIGKNKVVSRIGSEGKCEQLCFFPNRAYFIDAGASLIHHPLMYIANQSRAS